MHGRDAREGCTATFGGYGGEEQLQQRRILTKTQTPAGRAVRDDAGSREGAERREKPTQERGPGLQHRQNKGLIYTRPDTGTLPWQ